MVRDPRVHIKNMLGLVYLQMPKSWQCLGVTGNNTNFTCTVNSTSTYPVDLTSIQYLDMGTTTTSVYEASMMFFGFMSLGILVVVAVVFLMKNIYGKLF